MRAEHPVDIAAALHEVDSAVAVPVVAAPVVAALAVVAETAALAACLLVPAIAMEATARAARARTAANDRASRHAKRFLPGSSMAYLRGARYPRAHGPNAAAWFMYRYRQLARGGGAGPGRAARWSPPVSPSC